jgi:thiamine biosynthesis lipoprotein ApbE
MRLATIDARALGSAVRLVVTRPERAAAAKRAVDAVLADVDRTCSRFREDSELSQLNASPDREVQVSTLLARALATALRAARMSDGAVDPTVGGAMRAVGYASDFATVEADGGAIRLVATPLPGWRRVLLDERGRRVRLPRGVELDLGATGRALAADLAAAGAVEAAGGGALVGLGGDIALAGEAPDGGWRVQIGEEAGEPIHAGAEVIRLVAGGIATSSTTVRRWTPGGVVLHHLLDPSTGLPAGGPWRTATVVAATCVAATTASTAAIVRGEQAVAWLASLGMPARLVDRHGRVCRLGGWPLPGGGGW